MLDVPYLPERSPESHKGSFGLALIIGGSRGMAGAVAMAGLAALRGGAGRVRLAVPEACLDTVAGFEPSYMTVPLPCDAAGRISLAARERIIEQAEAATVVACGPGLGRTEELAELVTWLYVHLARPMLLDADALVALASRPEVYDQPGDARILTPHPGEFARLMGKPQIPPESRERTAMELARRAGIIVLLKGHRTLVTDGQRSYRNPTGNPGMATGGSGDVLTGLVTALACQQLSPFDAAGLGAYLHGLAGDLAAAQLSQEAMIASDLIRFLPAAFKQYREEVSDPSEGEPTA